MNAQRQSGKRIFPDLSILYFNLKMLNKLNRIYLFPNFLEEFIENELGQVCIRTFYFRSNLFFIQKTRLIQGKNCITLSPT